MKNYVIVFVSCIFLFCVQVAVAYEQQPTFTPSDSFYGDYTGTIKIEGEDIQCRAMVIPEKHKDRPFHYRVRIIETVGDRETVVELFGGPENGKVELSGERDGKWTGVIKNGVLIAGRKGDKPATFHGRFTRRKSPTEGLQSPNGATVLLPYKPGVKTNLDQWKNKNWKLMDDGSVEVASGGNVSLSEFGAVQMHVEFAVPYKCYDFGQGRGNSGVYLLGRYEVQVLDSYGFNTEPGNCGGIYANHPASVEHVCLPPAYWQTYDITFYPARFGGGGKRILPAKTTVVHNGITIHKNAEIKNAPTPASIASNEAPTGPLHIQDHGNPVRFRNIWYSPIEDSRLNPEELTKITAAAPKKATAKPKKPRKMLVLSYQSHDEGRFAGESALKVMGKQTGAYELDIVRTKAEMVDVVVPEVLKKYDAVCVNNSTGGEGNAKNGKTFVENISDYVSQGGGLVGIHAATDNRLGEVFGGFFSGHPWSEEVGIMIDDPKHELCKVFDNKNFMVHDEIYQFTRIYKRTNMRILLSLDMTKTADKGQRVDGDNAVAWVKSLGKGRIFYCSLGHNRRIFQDPKLLRFYLDGIQFALGDIEADMTPSSPLKEPRIKR